jgi:hypothetical protein
VPLSHVNIGHCDVTFYTANSNLSRFEEGIENPRVGGSIPPLATIRIKVLVKNDTDVKCPIFIGWSRSISVFFGI